MARYQPSQKKRSTRRPAPADEGPKTAGVFSRLVLDQLGQLEPREQLENGASESPAGLVGEDLVHLDYADEIAIKDAAFAKFWRRARLPGVPRAIITSPRPRGYRTTSKRRVARVGDTAYLFLGDRKVRRDMPVFVESALEPAEHTQLYRFLQAKLSESPFRVVAEHLSWLVVRGSYRERAVIFNVDMLSGPLVRKLKTLGRELVAFDPPVVAAFVYVDESGSDYYLEARRPSRGTLDYKKLFGPESLRVAYDDLRLSFHPTSFCQVNESIVPRMLRIAADMLDPRTDERLIDLYCGYGMFSHALAGRVGEVVGVDAARASIDAAGHNARRLGYRAARFIESRVNIGSIERLPDREGDELVVLDPPRNGTERGVIAAVAARRPRRVVHVFCSVDEIPNALRQWKVGGYIPVRVAPLDMFAGTPNLEVFVQLELPASRR
jgi:tRNA/tmRNA/rRNA uracil-C5-methylase (TrmA/RlmC/RlmD family)